MNANHTEVLEALELLAKSESKVQAWFNITGTPVALDAMNGQGNMSPIMDAADAIVAVKACIDTCKSLGMVPEVHIRRYEG